MDNHLKTIHGPEFWMYAHTLFCRISLKRHRRPSHRGEIQFYHVGLTGSTEQNATTKEMYSLPVLHEILDQEVRLQLPTHFEKKF